MQVRYATCVRSITGRRRAPCTLAGGCAWLGVRILGARGARCIESRRPVRSPGRARACCGPVGGGWARRRAEVRVPARDRSGPADVATWPETPSKTRRKESLGRLPSFSSLRPGCPRTCVETAARCDGRPTVAARRPTGSCRPVPCALCSSGRGPRGSGRSPGTEGAKQGTAADAREAFGVGARGHIPVASSVLSRRWRHAPPAPGRAGAERSLRHGRRTRPATRAPFGIGFSRPAPRILARRRASAVAMGIAGPGGRYVRTHADARTYSLVCLPLQGVCLLARAWTEFGGGRWAEGRAHAHCDLPGRLAGSPDRPGGFPPGRSADARWARSPGWRVRAWHLEGSPSQRYTSR